MSSRVTPTKNARPRALDNFSPIWRADEATILEQGGREPLFEGIEYQDPCYVIEYSSLSNVPPDQVELIKISQAARRNNRRAGVTGHLYYFASTNSFYQRLEGPGQTIQTIFNRIIVDPRHHDVQIQRAALGRRIFSRWDMLVTPVLDAKGSTNPDVLYRNTLQAMHKLRHDDSGSDSATFDVTLNATRRAKPPTRAENSWTDTWSWCLAKTDDDGDDSPVRDTRRPSRMAGGAPRWSQTHERRSRPPKCGRQPAWLRPSIPLNPHSPWYAVLRCEHIMRHGAGFLRVVGPPQSMHLGRKIYVPSGYLTYVGNIYAAHLKIKDPINYHESTPMEEREIIATLPTLHYGWDHRVPREDRVAPPPWATESMSMETDFSAPPPHMHDARPGPPPPRVSGGAPVNQPPQNHRRKPKQKWNNPANPARSASALAMSALDVMTV